MAGRKKATQAANEGVVAVEEPKAPVTKAPETQEAPKAEEKKEAAKSDYKSVYVNNCYHEDRVMKLKETVQPLTAGEDGKYHKTAEGEKPECYRVTVPMKSDELPNTNRVTAIANHISEKGENGKVYSAEFGANADGNIKVQWQEKNAEGKYEPREKSISIEEFKKGVEARQTELGRGRQAGKSDAVAKAMAEGEKAEAAADKSKDAPQAEA